MNLVFSIILEIFQVFFGGEEADFKKRLSGRKIETPPFHRPRGILPISRDKRKKTETYGDGYLPTRFYWLGI